MTITIEEIAAMKSFKASKTHSQAIMSKLWMEVCIQNRFEALQREGLSKEEIRVQLKDWIHNNIPKTIKRLVK